MFKKTWGVNPPRTVWGKLDFATRRITQGIKTVAASLDGVVAIIQAFAQEGRNIEDFNKGGNNE